jgi:hypothetical protein
VQQALTDDGRVKTSARAGQGDADMVAIYRLTESHGRQTYVATGSKREAKEWFRENWTGYKNALPIERVNAICIANIPNIHALEATELGDDGNWRYIYCKPLAERKAA